MYVLQSIMKLINNNVTSNLEFSLILYVINKLNSNADNFTKVILNSMQFVRCPTLNWRGCVALSVSLAHRMLDVSTVHSFSRESV